MVTFECGKFLVTKFVSSKAKSLKTQHKMQFCVHKSQKITLAKIIIRSKIFEIGSTVHSRFARFIP